MIRAAQPGLTSQALMLGELSSALLSCCLPSHTDTWSISSSSTPLENLASLSAEQEQQIRSRLGTC